MINTRTRYGWSYTRMIDCIL